MITPSAKTEGHQKKIDAEIMQMIAGFMHSIPGGIASDNGLTVFIPYYVLERVKNHLEAWGAKPFDITSPIKLFGTEVRVGYENYLVACSIQYGGTENAKIFKMHIE